MYRVFVKKVPLLIEFLVRITPKIQLKDVLFFRTIDMNAGNTMMSYTFILFSIVLDFF